MNELIHQEKTRLQALFDPFNERGSWMTLAEGSEEPIWLGIMEGFTVTRVAPQFDTGGNVTHVDFGYSTRRSDTTRASSTPTPLR